MEYLVIRNQGNQGCDYTIGCGINYEFMEADTIDAILEEIFYPDGREELDGYSYVLDDDSEFSLDEILIIPTEHVIKVDLDRYKKAYKDREETEKQIQKEAEEKALLAKLEAKYRKGSV
jgi:hypothetical protein